MDGSIDTLSFVAISFVATKNTRGGKIARALIIILGELSDRSKCRVQVKLPRVKPHRAFKDRSFHTFRYRMWPVKLFYINVI